MTEDYEQQLLKRHTEKKREEHKKEDLLGKLRLLERIKQTRDKSRDELLKLRLPDIIPFFFVMRRMQKVKEFHKAEGQTHEVQQDVDNLKTQTKLTQEQPTDPQSQLLTNQNVPETNK